MITFFQLVFIVFTLLLILETALIYIGLFNNSLTFKITKRKKVFFTALLLLLTNTVPLYLYSSATKVSDLHNLVRLYFVYPYPILLSSVVITSSLLAIVIIIKEVLIKLQKKDKKLKNNDNALLTRRDFIGNTSLGLFILSSGLFSYGAYDERTNIQIKKHSLSFKNLPKNLDGITFSHISDIHAGPYLSFEELNEIVEKVNSLKSDLIFITGDIINHNKDYLKPAMKILNNLEAKYGVFTVLGNHEYYAGINYVLDELKKTKIKLLRDDIDTFDSLNNELVLAGIDDPVSGWSKHFDFKNFSKIGKNLEKNKFNILLSHRPGILDSASYYNVDLILSGHTHGGQVVMPIPFIKKISLADLNLKYVRGFYKKNNTLMYVNKGIGTIVAPIRINCPPEIVQFKLTR